MIIFLALISAIALAMIFFALRIPVLELATHSSESEKLQILDDWLEKIHNKEKFNGVVLLSKHGKIIFSGAYGHDSAGAVHSLTEHSSFNLASVSKQFTAMGIILLNNRSRLKYTDKISDYIPELSFYQEITIQNLLHHTSGLPDYIQLVTKYRDNTGTLTTSEMISLYAKHQPELKFKPGEKFQYSNTGYVLLAEIIERVSGVSFGKFMTVNIFEPLNMKNTQLFNLLSLNEPAHRVYGYKRKFGIFGGKKDKSDLNFLDGVAGDGGIYSSAYDLYLWHKGLSDETLISNEIYKKAYTPAILNNGKAFNYGFGWFINNDGTVEHAGGWQGFTSYIHRNLKKDELIILLDNSSNALRVNSKGFFLNSIGLNLQHFMKSL